MGSIDRKRAEQARMAVELRTRAARTGACFSCVLGNEAAADLRPHDTYLTCHPEWGGEEPNPLPAFCQPDGFYAPIFLPSSYWPLRLPPPEESEGDIRFYPIVARDTALRLEVFHLHEGVHRTLVRYGIVPALMRLAAARSYLSLAAMLGHLNLAPRLWRHFTAQNALIERLFEATVLVHEAMANVFVLRHLSRDNPYAETISLKSIAYYESISGTRLGHLCELLNETINTLSRRFHPAPVQIETELLLAEYAISSAVSLEEIRADVLSGPDLVTDVDQALCDRGIHYNIRRPSQVPVTFDFPRYNVRDATDSFEAVLTAVAGGPPPSEPVRSSLDQLRYLASCLPALQRWLAENAIREWLRVRVMDAIHDCQALVENAGFPLALMACWEERVAPYQALRSGFPKDSFELGARSTVWNTPLPEDELSPFGSVPGDYWLAFRHQDGMPACMFGPACRDADTRFPLYPWAWIAMPEDEAPSRNLQILMTGIRQLIFFEGIRQQFAVGCGVSCPLRGGDGRCCGAAETIRKVYELGCRALRDGGWKPIRWTEPIC